MIYTLVNHFKPTDFEQISNDVLFGFRNAKCKMQNANDDVSKVLAYMPVGRWNNDASELDILGHFGTLWDILGPFGRLFYEFEALLYS